jgi:FixJ family two-component response regulator
VKDPARNVAVVDDDESVRRALERLLKVDGLHAQSFPSAQAFLACPEGEDFGCLVLDIHLGGMSGLDLLERLSAEGRHLPVIIITAHDDQQSRDRACAAGAAAYFRKPVDARQLLSAIRTAMDSAAPR